MVDYTRNNIGSGYNTTSAINSELEKVETAVNSKLDKTGGSLSGDLSMESNDLLNVSHTYTAGLTLNGEVVTSVDSLGTVAFPSLSSVTYTNTATGAVGRGLQSKLDDIVSVKDFGAVGDGVTDDTAAIQAAIDAVRDTVYGSASGGEVFFPTGHYRISSTITLRDRVALKGAGCRATYVQATDGFTDTAMFLAIDEPAPTTSMFGAFITDMQIDYNDLNIAGSAIIYARAWQENSGLRRVVLTGWRDTAVKITDGYGGAASLRLEDVEAFTSVDGGLIGIDCQEISATGDFFLDIHHCTIAGNSSNILPEGIKVAKDTVFCTGLHFEYCTSGVSLYDASDFQSTNISGGPSVTNVITRNSTHTGNILLGFLARRTATNAIKDNRSSGAGPDIARDLTNYNSVPSSGSEADVVAWCVFNASTATIIDSYNISSITDNGPGDFTFNFTNPTPALSAGGDRPVIGNFSVTTADELWVQNAGGTASSHTVRWKRGGAFAGGGYDDPRASVIILGRTS